MDVLSTSGVCLSWGSDIVLLVNLESGGSHLVRKTSICIFPSGLTLIWLGCRTELSAECSDPVNGLPLFRYYKAMGKREHPFSASSILGSGSLSLTMSFRTSEDNLKNMRPFASREKKNRVRRYNGLKCRCHYVQCLMLNEYSKQHRLHGSFYVPALFANSHGCTLLFADT